MKTTKKMSPNLVISIILFVVYAATYIIDLFTFKAITVSSAALCIGALIIYTLFLRWLKPLYYMGILVFTFFAQYLGGMLKFYEIIPIYDVILHLCSGTLLVLLADYLYEILAQKTGQKDTTAAVRLFFCFLFSTAAAAVWEIWEFSGDKLLGLSSQLNSLDDTMTDIVSGTIGAVIGTAVLYFICRRRKSSHDLPQQK